MFYVTENPEVVTLEILLNYFGYEHCPKIAKYTGFLKHVQNVSKTEKLQFKKYIHTLKCRSKCVQVLKFDVTNVF